MNSGASVNAVTKSGTNRFSGNVFEFLRHHRFNATSRFAPTVDGERVDVGRMNFSQDLAYWVGRTPSVADVPDGTTFGVSLTDLDGSGTQADPVIVGDL